MKDEHMKQLVALACISILLTIGTTACEVADQETQAQKPAVSSPAPTPSDVTYSIINSNVVPGIKRSLEVRLSRKVEEDALRTIAMDLRKSDPNQYERTFIVYYLADMQVGAGGWATTHFNPDLEVNILGITIEQGRAFVAEGVDTARDVVGNWLDQSPMAGGKISIYRKGGEHYMERKFKDGSSSIKELVEKASSNGERYEEKGGSRFGEHYIIDRHGNLQIRDREGLITTARKME